jgi:hypothetical protein
MRGILRFPIMGRRRGASSIDRQGCRGILFRPSRDYPVSWRSKPTMRRDDSSFSRAGWKIKKTSLSPQLSLKLQRKLRLSLKRRMRIRPAAESPSKRSLRNPHFSIASFPTIAPVVLPWSRSGLAPVCPIPAGISCTVTPTADLCRSSWKRAAKKPGLSITGGTVPAPKFSPFCETAQAVSPPTTIST